MPHLTVTAAFQHVDVSQQVALGIAQRVGQGVAHSRLRRQVNHPVKVGGAKQRRHGRAVGDIDRMVGEVGIGLQRRQARLLERHIVIVVQVVDALDLMPRRQQTATEIGTDKTGAASY